MRPSDIARTASIFSVLLAFPWVEKRLI
jgi:hypothetical protein